MTLLAPADTQNSVTIPLLDVVIPVYNEEADLERCVTRLLAHLERLPLTYGVTIADNASTDATPEVARQLAATHPAVEVVRIEEKGRGRALREVWGRSSSPIVAYMDVDLSTDLNALLPLVAPLMSGHSDVAIGTRLSRGSRVRRGMKREVISRAYNIVLRGTLRARFSDAQCGFKALRREAVEELLPLVRDNGWFFDTELLVLAERGGLRIHEVPVDWIDDPDSRVDIVRTAVDDLRGIARLGWSLLRGEVPLDALRARLGRTTRAGAEGSLRAQVVIFALIGLASTLAYGLLYVALRGWLPAQGANTVALVVTAVANTAANRRFTFGVRGTVRRWRHQAQGLMVFGAGWAATSATLWLTERAWGAAHPLWEVACLTVANLVVTVVRFLAMRTWIFRRSAEPKDQPSGRGPASSGGVLASIG